MQPTPTQFIMLGGFLGAGKTTAIARLATDLIRDGRQVGLVTNDQSHDLVDTQSLRSQGFSVGEVSGACFCCKFDELVGTLRQLGNDHRPDVIIAEPVGSCTDLVATVLEPLRQWHDTDFRVGPLGVLLKPEHGRKILRAPDGGGFSPKAAYIFLKQIEEAQVVAINKIDKLTPAEIQELVGLVQERFPDKLVVSVSAKTGIGFAQLLDALTQESTKPFVPMPIDYEIYAEGEAELGWLNSTLLVQSSSSPFSLNELVGDFLARFQQALAKEQAEPAHLKVSAQSGNSVAVGNLVDSNSPVELSRPCPDARLVDKARLTVNARVITDPQKLEGIVRRLMAELSDTDIQCTVERMDHFRPLPPTPTHRLTD